MTRIRYAELQAMSNFSFLEGAAHPEELVARAAGLGLDAIAVTDRNSLAGVVRAHVAAKEEGLRLVIGARLDLGDGLSLLAYPKSRTGYGHLCRLITLGRRRAPKGECVLTRADVLELGGDQIFLLVPPPEPGPDETFVSALREFSAAFPGDCYLAAHHLYRGDDAARIETLSRLAAAHDAPLVATNDVRMHEPSRRALADVLTCIREKCTVRTAGFRLAANAERHLKSAKEMARLFKGHENAVRLSAEIAARCRFSLDELRYEYPDEVNGAGEGAQARLERLTSEGAKSRYPRGVPEKIRTQLAHELKLVAELGYAPYFLTVHDLVRFARERGILCQGRGSAANSAVCYCLGITAVDPNRMDLLFERFISAARNEPPDIDVDFEHERREEVIQYIYGKYGRERAGLAATVIHYRAKSAIRDVGKAMGLSLDAVNALSGQIGGGDADMTAARVREIGFDPDEPNMARVLELADTLEGFPRHLSQHVGGFVITRGPLCEVVPIENAAMADRTVIEWDKDDLDALGILKVDVLALGMLTCIRKCFELLRASGGPDLTLATVPPEDPRVYEMLTAADSVGVFQVESRAQMSFLPRMKPRNFYDLVIEVAIIRPGPIQGDMVHPYIRRRNGLEAVDYPSEELRAVLGKTLGVPLFQEQAMKISIVAAGFTASEADNLRRAMATFRRVGLIHKFRAKMVEGMAARGYNRDFAERCFNQIEGFGEYGFPESHAASFALLVYVSAWLKCHHPAAFACALLNSQPMGFYAPAQIVRDAREHGVEIRPVDVNRSDWDCTLEPGGNGPALRLGFRQIKGCAEKDIEKLLAARGNGYADVAALWRKSGLSVSALETLARADAMGSMELNRRNALWAVRGLPPAPLPLFSAMGAEEMGDEPAVALPEMPLGAEVIEDYATLRLSLKAHPMALLRGHFAGARKAADLDAITHGTPVTVAGLVLVRQRPGTAKGVIFMTLEDETGIANVIVWPKTYARFRRTVIAARLVAVSGVLQREGPVIHVIADRLADRSERLAWLLEGHAPAPPEAAGTAAPRAPAVPLARPFPSRNFH